MPLGRSDLGLAPARWHWCTTPRRGHLPPRYVRRLALPRPGHPKKHPARNSTTEDVPKQNKGPVRRSSLAQGDQSAAPTTWGILATATTIGCLAPQTIATRHRPASRAPQDHSDTETYVVLQQDVGRHLSTPIPHSCSTRSMRQDYR
jgi:hypothetical protein